jgi:hypothetical protein
MWLAVRHNRAALSWLIRQDQDAATSGLADEETNRRHSSDSCNGIDSSFSSVGLPSPTSGRARAAPSPIRGSVDWSSPKVCWLLVVLCCCILVLKLLSLGFDAWDSEYYAPTQSHVFYGLLSSRALYASGSSVVTTYRSMCPLMSGDADRGTRTCAGQQQAI